MQRGTRVLLAAAGLLIGAIVVYYGVLSGPATFTGDPQASEPQPAGQALVGAAPPAPESAPERTRPAATPALGRVADQGPVVPDVDADASGNPAPSPFADPLRTGGRIATPGLVGDRVAEGDVSPRPVPARAAPGSRQAELQSGGAGGVQPEPGAHQADGAQVDGALRIPEASRHAADPQRDERDGPGSAPPEPAVHPRANVPARVEGATRSSTTPARGSDPAPPVNATHVVGAGETLTSIAAAWFGDGRHWSLIAQANPGLDPDRLGIGQRLVLPPKSAASAPAAAAVRSRAAASAPGDRATPSGSARTHVVRSGETLSSIARTWFGDATRWRSIYDANRRLIGTDPGRLEVGMALAIPLADR